MRRGKKVVVLGRNNASKGKGRQEYQGRQVWILQVISGLWGNTISSHN